MSFRSWLSGKWILTLLVVLVSAELTARVEDYLRLGVPFAAVPDRERDLVLHDAIGIRGRPNGVYKKWHLNSFGFRSPEVARAPAPGCTRVMVLGASETFGLYESEDKEFPAQLDAALDRHGCFEVLNAAVAGLTLRGLERLWTGWGSQFGARFVVVYPTPGFYLANSAPTYPGPPPSAPPPPARWSLRLMERARDVIEIPDFIQNWRIARQLAQATPADPGWAFTQAPGDRLGQFQDDLLRLVEIIRDAQAIPVLVTHANVFGRQAQPSDRAALDAWRQFTPRASADVLLEFEAAAARATAAVAERAQVPLVDAAAVMNGRREWFADALHFTDEGAGTIASLIAERILQVR